MSQPAPPKHSPAAERNGRAILACLQELLPTQGRALEIASGTGQHVALFGAHLPGWIWQPSDLSGDDFSSISLWCKHNSAARVLPPVSWMSWRQNGRRQTPCLNPCLT